MGSRTTKTFGAPRGKRRLERRSRRFRIVRAAALGLAVLLVASTGASIAPALTAPGTDSVAARLAEWGRDHGLGWAVTLLERVQYAKDAPTVGGSIAGGLPTVAPDTGSGTGRT